MAVITDPVTTVVSLLGDNWVAGNVDSTTPTIDESWDLGKTNLKRGDFVRCYEVSGVDISTAVSRSRLRKIYGEVVRILRAYETSPGTDYNLVRASSRVDQTDKQRRWYRYVLDCDLISYEAT